MNKALLEYEIKKNGYSTATFCKAVGISLSAYYKKCNGTSEFKQSEISKIVSLLHLDSPVQIFFDNDVS